MKTIGVLTSGGDAPGMNAAIRAVVRTAIYNDMLACGIYNGFEGLINGDIEEFGLSSVSDIIHRGGTMLRTARSERYMTEEGFNEALEQCRLFGITDVVVIGGDGSFRGARSLQKAGIGVIGIPGTIDNDLGYTERTIGFDTAVNTVVSLLGNIRDTSTSHGRATVVEVMGRHCGDIALNAGIAAGAESILTPENPVDIDKICSKMLAGKKRQKLHSIIMKAEGVDIGTQELADILQERTGISTRAVVPGYIQRGGSPTAADRILASKCGYRAVELIRQGITGRAVGVKGSEIIDVDLDFAIESENPANCDCELAGILSI